MSNELKVIWQPQQGAQQLFLSCPIYEVLIEGTRGGGKTDVLLMDFAQHTGQGFGPAWRGIIFRETYKQLDDIVTKSKRWFRQIFPSAKFNESDYEWTFADGEQLLFRYMRTEDDYWNYHGHEYPFIGWEELTNWPDPKCYESMKACCRSSFPDPNLPRKFRATCNPFGAGHSWVKEYFIDQAPPCTVITNAQGKKRLYIKSRLSENKALMAADPEYIRTLESILDEAKRKAWLEGSWDILAGGIFGNLWQPSTHVVRPFEIPSSWYIDRSFDWGSSKPFSVCWWAESDGTEATMADGSTKCWPKGSVFLISEWYGWNGTPNTGCEMLAGQIAAGIKEREKLLKLNVRPGPADNAIFDTQNGNCIGDDMAAQGVKWTRSDKSPGSRVNGWEAIRQLLFNATNNPKEEPGLYIFDTCRHWLRTVPNLPRDNKKPDDVDTNAEDHAGDATRYRIAMPRKRTTSEEIML